MLKNRTLFYLIVALLPVAACADKPLPTDAVRDADSAIEIAKKFCGYRDDSQRRWDARLHGGIWDVRQYFAGESGTCGWQGAKVRASDGSSSGGEACVVTE
jgi:hypothetical protein